MQRCEEIFRQICWLEERFWPDVDGMGEEDDSARLGPGIAPMGTGLEGMNGGMSGNMSGGPMNNGPMSASLNGSMTQHMTGQINGGDATPVVNNRNSFGMSNGDGLEGVNQDS